MTGSRRAHPGPVRSPRMRLRGGRLVLPLVMVALAATACSAGPAAQRADTSTLVIGQSQDITDFNPWSFKGYSYNVTSQLFDTPIRYDASGKPQPQLATSWQQAPDGKSMTLHLRSGVHFHNGDAFTSADIAYSIKAATDPANVANLAPLAELVTKVDTPDTQTAVLHYAKPNPAALDLLELLYVADHNHPDTVRTDTNGTGPFVLEKFDPGQEVTLSASTDYWGGAPSLKTVKIEVLPDAATTIAQLKTGSVNLSTRMAPQDVASLAGDSSIATGAAAQGQGYLSFDVNTSRPPLNNPVVRQAFSLALDRARIAKEIVGPATPSACLPYPKTSLAYFEDLDQTCKFDLAQAKTLLAQAGVPNLSVTIQTSSAESPELTQMSQIFQADLKSIGVDAKVDDLDDPTYVKDRQNSQFEIEAHAYGRAGGDPATMFGTANSWVVGKNPQNFNQSDYASAVSAGGSVLDPDVRKQAYRRVDQIILDQNFVLVAAENTQPWASSKNLAGVEFTAEGLLVLHHAHFS